MLKETARGFFNQTINQNQSIIAASLPFALSFPFLSSSRVPTLLTLHKPSPKNDQKKTEKAVVPRGHHACMHTHGRIRRIHSLKTSTLLILIAREKSAGTTRPSLFWLLKRR